MSMTVVGQYALHGFFILSGYLMTYVMHNTYGYSAKGIVYFGVNRFLQLFPAYWAICVPMVACISYAGVDYARTFNPNMGIPD